MPKYSVIVIGCGPAGHTCAVRLAQLGAKVAVVERDYVGGICTNWGCTPSKSMIESAKIARVVREASRYGVNRCSRKKRPRDRPAFSVSCPPSSAAPTDPPAAR